MRRLLIVIGTILVLLFFIFIGWSLSRPAISGPFTRTAEPQVLWGGGEVEVNLALSSTALPSCELSNRSANIVLLIDRSGSMQGDAFREAVNAADAFVQTVDLTVHQVAILFFSDETTPVQPLTNDLTTLQAALFTQPTNEKTMIAKALQAAQSTLSNTQNGSHSVIILLSDGGAKDEKEAANVGLRLKEAGVRIVTLALPGQDQNPVFMGDLASGPSDAVDSPSLADLTAIYRSLAEGINEGVAFDVRVEERVSTDSFSVVADSLDPTGELLSAGIDWQVATLPEGVNMFRYRLTTNGLGLRTVSPAEGEASLKDCAGGTPSWTLPSGPDVLILPSMWLCLPLLLLLLIPLLFFGFWDRIFGGKKSQSEPPPSPLISNVPSGPPPVVDETPTWIKQLNASLMLDSSTRTVEQSTLQNTLLIGCGPAGHEVLLQVAEVLSQRFGGQLPANVRLVQVDVQLQGGVSASSFPDELKPLIQHVLLRPNLEEVERNLRDYPDRWAHWKWYQGSGQDRSIGRMALFYDLRNGSANSELWSALHKMLADLGSPKIRLIGTTFDDTSSGMLVDIARLTQAVKGIPLDVEFWLAGPVGLPWSARLNNPRQRVRPDEQRVRTLATLRELTRFQRNTSMPFIYVPPSNRQSELRAKAGGVVQSLFLFQPIRTAKLDPKDDVLACMAESLLALLHPSVNSLLVQLLNDNQQRAGIKKNEEGQGLTCAIGCYAFRLPGQPLVEALTWRLVRDLLYDVTVGLVPRNECQADGSQSIISDDEREDLIDRTKQRQAAEVFVNRFANASYGIDSPAFAHALRNEVETILNGEGDNDVVVRSNGLQRAQVWLDFVRKLVLRQRQPAVARKIEALVEELEAWERWLIGNVYQVSQQYWQQARAELERLRQQPARNWLVDEKLEWPVYQKEVRSWIRQHPGGSSDPLLRAGKRFGWEVRLAPEGRGWTLHLLVPPSDFIWQGNRAITSRFIVERNTSPDKLLQGLYEIAKAFTRLKNRADLLLTQAQRQDANEWLQLTKPKNRLDYNESNASDEMSQISEVAILVGPAGPQLNKINAKLSGVQARLKLSSHKTADNSSVSLLRIVDWIPLSTTSEYNAQTRHTYPVSPELHVWRAEQVAAEIEQDGAELSAIFVNWLATDEEVVDLFARSYLYGATEKRGSNWRIPQIGVLRGHSPTDILRQLIENPPGPLQNNRKQILKAWEQEIIKQENNVMAKNKRAFQRRTKDEKIAPLLSSHNALERDLGGYLQYLITPRY